jgi:hypothetical protein
MRGDSDIQFMIKDVTQELGTIEVLVNSTDSLLHCMKKARDFGGAR